jgi:ubiquinone/menaquinone biosynthesis C-methylase UbiE
MKTLSRDYDPEEVRRSYAAVRWIYGFWGWLTERRAHAQVLKWAEIRDGMRVLEVAVGTGSLFHEIVRLNPLGSSEGMDLSEDMLKVARRKLRSEKGSFELRVASAYELPFENESFDVLVNTFMLDLLPERDYPRILGEFRRVLRPGGRLVIATMAFGHTWYHRLWYLISKRFPSLLTNCRPVSIARHLAASGFEIQQHQFISQNSFPSEVIAAAKKQ